jgi:PAS domain S-box-containing protein
VARIGSWEWDIATDRVTSSAELYRLYGLEPDSVEVTFETFLEHVHPEDRDKVRHVVIGAYRDRQQFAVEHRAVMPDGFVRWLHGRGRVIVDETGAPVRMVGTAQDVTERKRLDELRDNILSAVSHELRTPLTSIVGFSLTLRDKGLQLSEEARAEIVNHLTVQAVKLDRLLSDLLDLDRLRHGLVRPTFRATDIGRLAEQVVSEYQSDGQEIAVQAESVVAEVDAAKIERIVENLLANAIKHTAPGTEIRVRVESYDGGVLIAVEDRGSGVPETHRRSIFEIFDRGSAVANIPGTGIGLSLVSKFAALHGGRVWVQENPGGGASFRVFLPARRDG